MQDENKRLRDLTAELLEWIEKNAGWDYGFDMNELEKLTAKAIETLKGPRR